jgi:hypothetical protein
MHDIMPLSKIKGLRLSEAKHLAWDVTPSSDALRKSAFMPCMFCAGLSLYLTYGSYLTVVPAGCDYFAAVIAPG